MSLPLATGVLSPGTKPTISKPVKTHRRFDRAARLFTEPGLHELMRSHVAIFGIGGVGSFAAESLARSGVGTLTIVDFDQICVTNANRQLHALKGNTGKFKVEVMAERLELINPLAQINPIKRFYNKASSEELLLDDYDFVIDAIDNMTAKAHLLVQCKARAIPVVSCMGAAARMDPTKIEVNDLSDTRMDPMARSLRKLLNQNYDWNCRQGNPVGIKAVYSIETPIVPTSPGYEDGKGFQCVCPNGSNNMHSCEKRSRIDGSASFVTGAFGLAAASVVARGLIDSASQ